MEAVPEPTVRKGPTPEQITAIKVCCLTAHVLSEAPARRDLLLVTCHIAILTCSWATWAVAISPLHKQKF